MSLTAKQEEFCKQIALGKDKSEAYRLAYPKSKGKAETIHVNASKLANNTKVALRIEELQKKGEKRFEITFDGNLKKLHNISELALEKERYSDAISAVKEQNKMLGYYEKDNTQKAITVNIPPIEWAEPQK